MIKDNKEIYKTPVFNIGHLSIHWLKNKYLNNQTIHKVMHRIDGPCTISIDWNFSESSLCSERTVYEYTWGWNNQYVIPYPTSLSLKQVVKFKKFYNQKEQIGLVVRKVEGLIYEIVIGNQKLLLMKNQKRYMKKTLTYET